MAQPTLRELAAQSPIVLPPTASEAKPKLDPDLAICDALGLDVMGETEAGGIRVFSTRLRKDSVINSISRFTYEDLLQLAGRDVKKLVHEAPETIPGQHHFKAVKRAIAGIGGETQIPTGAWKGIGCWPGENKEVVLVGAGQAAVWDGKTLTAVYKPRVAGLFLDLSSGEQWYDFEKLKKHLLGMNPNWVAEVLNEVVGIFDRWIWRQTGDIELPVCPYLITGLILATWVQTGWTWRPMVAIRGESNSGKSMLFEAIGAMFGRLALLSTKPTEAGLRQAVGGRATAIMVDEFESDKHRQQILELFRTSSRGSTQLRGTSNQDGRSTGLRHIAWVAAVEVGLERAPDRNRYMFFEVMCPPKELMGQLEVPPVEHLAELGQKMLAIAVYYQRQAFDLHETLKRYSIPDIHNRVIESYAVPVSMLALARGMEATKLIKVILEALGGEPEANETDQQSLLSTILGTSVFLNRNVGEVSIGTVLSDPDSSVKDLERVGIALVNKKRGRPPADPEPGSLDLFIEPVNVKRYVLKETAWATQSIQQILVRLEGAEWTQRTIGGRRIWGVKIPWATVERDFLKEGGVDQF